MPPDSTESDSPDSPVSRQDAMMDASNTSVAERPTRFVFVDAQICIRPSTTDSSSEKLLQLLSSTAWMSSP